MRSVGLTVILLIYSISLSSSLSAQEKTSYSVTPRVWYAYMDLPLEVYASFGSFSIPMYGATFSVSPSFTDNFSVLLTFLTGECDEDGTFVWGESATLDAKRTDTELLIRYVVPDRNLFFHAGARYVTFDGDLAGSVENFVMPGNWDVFRPELETDMWVALAGLGVTTNISERGRHRLFSNFTLGIAFSNWDYKDNQGLRSSGDDTSPLLDFNSGYQYSMDESWSFSIRYRLFTYQINASVINDTTEDKLVTIHGPEASLTFTF